MKGKTGPLLGSFFQQPIQQTTPGVPGLHFPELHLLFFPLTLALLKLQDSVTHLLLLFRRQRFDLPKWPVLSCSCPEPYPLRMKTTSTTHFPGARNLFRFIARFFEASPIARASAGAWTLKRAEARAPLALQLRRLALIPALLLMLAGLCLFADAPAGLAQSAANPPLTGDKAIEHLKATGQYDSLAAAVTGARYAVKPVEEGSVNPQAAALRAQNPAHGLNSTFSSEGLTLTVRTGEDVAAPAHTVGWRLHSLGYGTAQTPVPAGTLLTMGQRVELARTAPAVTEWFVNNPAGLEHGFTLPERPATYPRGEPLSLVIAVTGGLTPQADATGQSLALRDATGRTVLTYAKLKVWDATGMELPATMLVADGQVSLTVLDNTARYPLTIDPTFSQQAYLKASNTGAIDHFGYSVAVSSGTGV